MPGARAVRDPPMRSSPAAVLIDRVEHFALPRLVSSVASPPPILKAGSVQTFQLDRSRRPRASEQGPQLPLPQYFLRAGGNPLAPAAQLRQGDRVRRRRRADLDLDFSSRRDRIRPAVLPEQRNADDRGFVERFRRHVDRVAYTAWSDEAHGARAQGHERKGYQFRFIFASSLCSGSNGRKW